MIDLRSDTVTKPTAEMRQVMSAASVGDDVYGEDPTVNELEAMMAEMTGCESALFVSSGTQSNLLALLSHCDRGDEYIVGQEAHTYKYEGGGAAIIGSIQPQPIEFEPDGRLDLHKVETKIKPDDFHFAKTKLLCLENTWNGKTLPMAYIKDAADFAHHNGLSIHLDGARLFNAAIKYNLHIRETTKYFDSVSICLSKGLGAPVGSVLYGTHEFIKKARRWRKVVGGGMRQAGIVAAAGIYALNHHIDRLAEDHRNAARLAEGLSRISAIDVDFPDNQTNMVFFSMDSARAPEFTEFMKANGILVMAMKKGLFRLVVHLDISEKDIDIAIGRIQRFFD